MSETGPEGPPSGDLALTPLDPEQLPPDVLDLLERPTATRLMVASGVTTLSPADLLIAAYQLSFDPDEAVRAAAEAAASALPDTVVVSPLEEPLPAVVLHFFATHFPPRRVEPLERILLNRATADATIVVLAGRLYERELEIIFQNDVRILRCPDILRALYFNKSARMSSVNRAMELCARNDVRVEGIPEFDAVVKSILEERPRETVTDDGFVELLKDEPEEETAQFEKRRSAIIDFGRLKFHEKIRLAQLGNINARQVLIRDANRLVAMAVIRSPRLTDSEVVRAAANRFVSEDVIRYIANQREWLKMYPVRLALVQNPKCPLAFSLKFMVHLHGDDVKSLARSKSISSAVALAAKKLMQKRGAG